MIYPPQLSRAPHTGLHFIRDQENSIFFCGSAHTRPEIIRRNNRACLALNWFKHDSCDSNPNFVTNFQLFFYSFCIPKWNMIDLPTIHCTHLSAKI